MTWTAMATLVAEAMLPSQRLLNHVLLQEGLAWWQEKYAPDANLYRILEKQTKRDKVGLWADPGPVKPWAWRRNTHGLTKFLTEGYA